MKKLILCAVFFTVMFAFAALDDAQSQIVYITKYKSDADKIIYVSRYKSEANLIVYDSKYKSEAAPMSGIWYYTKYKSDADWKIYFTEYKSEADIIVDKLNCFSIIRENGYRFLPTNDWKKNNYYTILSQSASMMTHQISALSMKAFPPDILIRIPEDSFESYQFHKSAEIIEMGKVAAKKALLEFSEKKQS